MVHNPGMDTKPHTPASLRAVLALSAADLAARATAIARETDPAAYVSPQTVLRMERGLGVHLDHLRSIARALDVSIDALLAAIDTERARRAKGAA